jgi:Big-like domain-containing protein
MRPRSRWIAALTLVPAFLAACSETPPTGVEPPTTGPLLQISDAADSAGRAGFYFLPPMAPDPGPFTGTFDANLSPEVRICQLAGSVCGTTIKTFTTATTEPVEVSANRQTYGVNWSTKNNPSSLATNKQYRIEIRVGTTLLGFADLAFVKATKDLASVPAGTAGAVLGSPLNIKFRIETRTIGSVTVTPATAAIALTETRAFSAEVRDLHGARVPNASATWASTNTAAATVSPASGTGTTAMGLAVGNSMITATAGGVAGSASLTVMRKPNAEDDSYSGTAGELLSPGATPAIPTLLANDDAGSPAGSITSVRVDGTDHPLPLPQGGIPFAGGLLQLWSDGNFSVSTLTAGQFTFRYTLTNAAGSDDATVSVTMGVGSPAAMIALSDADQTATAGTAVAKPPSVWVTDAGGNPVAGVTVTFTPAPVGSVTGSPATTDANGVATAGSWTLGTIVGEMPERVQTVTATAGSLSRTFTGRAVAGTAASVTVPQFGAIIKTGESETITAIVRDSYGNPLYTRPIINWSSYDPFDPSRIPAASVSAFSSQSPAGSASATMTVTARDVARDRDAIIRASVNPFLYGETIVRVKSLRPFAVLDLFTAVEQCFGRDPFTGRCVTSDITFTGNVLVQNGGEFCDLEGCFEADYLGEPAAVISRFGIVGPNGQVGQWVAVGTTVIVDGFDEPIGSITLESDGKLTYTRPINPVMQGSGVEVVYELKNALGTSTAHAGISVKKAY